MSALTICIMSTSCRCSCSAGASSFAFLGLAFSSAGFAFAMVVYLPVTGFTPGVPLCVPFDGQHADLMTDFLPVEQVTTWLIQNLFPVQSKEGDAWIRNPID